MTSFRPVVRPVIITVFLIAIFLPLSFSTLHGVSLGPETLTSELESRYSEIKSFCICATRKTIPIHTRVSAEPAEERWTFYFDSPMNFRIHYDDRETERILIGNEKYVWEYLPAANCALRTDLRHLSTREKLLKVGLATRLVHVPFLLIRPDTDLFRNLVVKSDTSAAGEPDILATADIPFMGETLNGNIRFGTEHLNVKNIVLTDETDTTIFHCSYSGYKKISGDIWWPQKVEYLLKTKSGDFKSVVEFESVLLNENYNDKLFSLGKIKGLKMKTRKATVVKGGGNR